MDRTKLFISYSRLDGEWMERLKLHLALLERRKIVHIWSDTRIRVGDRWEAEIETALTESCAAVLMISPAFLASDYIWDKEMPHIMRHQVAGMLVFPLITKPCAWRIAPELAELQARPTNGRPLSLGSDAAVDSDLADFIYELAGLLGQMPASMASEEADRLRRQSEPDTGHSPIRPDPKEELSGGSAWLHIGKRWMGTYSATNRHMQLVILSVDRSADKPHTLRGKIEYSDDGTVTEIEGTLVERAEFDADTQLAKLTGMKTAIDGAIIFREVREINRGIHPVDRNGEYRATILGSRMSGFWTLNGLEPNYFEFTCEL